MNDVTRQILAYAILGSMILIGVPALIIFLRGRKRQKLRRRGIKRFGH